MASCARRARFALRLRLSSDRGFTLVEMMVALGVVFTSLLAIGYTATAGFNHILLARQRQAANGMANQLVEQVRALPFDTVRGGLRRSDLAGDPRILTSGCPSGAAYCYRSSPSAVPEEIVLGQPMPDADVVPLRPHQGVRRVGPTRYEWAVYVTYFQNDRTLNAFRVTAMIDWEAARGRPGQVVVQTIVHSPEGCVRTSTHPFAAPCQPFLYANASLPEGRMEVLPTPADAVPPPVVRGIFEVPFDRAVLWTAGQNANMQIEQVAAVQGSGITSGTTLQVPGAPEQTVGRVAVTSAVDTDPGGSPAQSDSSSASGGGAESLVSRGGGNALMLVSSGGDVADTNSTVASSSSSPCAGELDGQPCGSDAARQAGQQIVRLAFQEDQAAGLGDAELVVVEPPPPADDSGAGLVDRDLTANADNRIRADVERSIGEVRLGALPANLPGPPGWEGALVRLVSYADSAAAEAGTATEAPTATISSGVLRYWTGGGYAEVSLAGTTQRVAPSVPDLVSTQTVDGRQVTVSILQVSFTAGGVRMEETPLEGSTNARTAARAQAGPPLMGSFRYRVEIEGLGVNGHVADVTVAVNLEPMVASASYQPAPGSEA